MDAVVKRRLDKIHSSIDVELQKARYKYRQIEKKKRGWFRQAVSKEQFREDILKLQAERRDRECL